MTQFGYLSCFYDGGLNAPPDCCSVNRFGVDVVELILPKFNPVLKQN